MRKKRFHYLHVSYKAQLDTYSSIESDRFFRLKSCTLKELRQSIMNTIEKEGQRKVQSLTLSNINELSEDTFNMLMEGESFEDLDTSNNK